MSALQSTKNYGPPSAGLNSRHLPTIINDQEATVLLNCQVNGDGGLDKYPGYIKDGSPFPNSSTSFIRTIFDFKRGTSLDYLLIAASDAGNANATYKVDIKYTIGDGNYFYIGHTIGTATLTNGSTAVTGQNTSWTKELKPGDKIKATADADSKYTEITSVNSDTSLTLIANYTGTGGATAAYIARKVLSNTNIPRFTTFNNLAIIVDGFDIPQAYDGSSVNELINSYSGTTLTQAANAAPIMTAVISHKNRVFGYQNSNLYWCHVNDQTFWDPASFEPIFPQDGGDIVSIVSFADSIVVFKNNGKVYRVFGNFDDSAIGSPAYITRIDYSENLGIIGDRSCILHNNLLYFMCETGLYRIDPYWGRIEKISYLIDPTLTNFNFTVGAQTSKSYPFTTKSQWDLGTHNGTIATSGGTLQTFFDDYRQTDATTGYNLCSIAIGIDNVIHVAYIPNTNNRTVKYCRYKTDGTLSKENTGINCVGLDIKYVTIDVSAVDQTVGIACGYNNSGQSLFIERAPDVGLTLGTWGTQQVINTAGDNVSNGSFKYSSGGVPCFAWVSYGSPDGFVGYSQRNIGTWSTNQIDSGSPGAITSQCVSLTLDASNNIYISATPFGQDHIYSTKSTNGGVTFSLIENISVSPVVDANSTLASYLDHSNHFHSVYSNANHVVINRDHTAASNTTLDSTANSLCRGSFHIYQTFPNSFNTDVVYLYNITGTSPNQQEKFIFESANNVVNPTLNVINKSTGFRPGSDPFRNNGQVAATVTFGTNSGEIVIRRITFYGWYTGPENHDSTLTAWGTYAVSGVTSNGNTVTYQVALASSSPATSFNNITPGAVISSNANLIYIKPQIIVKLTMWGNVQIQSLVLNYTGAGIDSRQVFGISYYNEAYFAGSQIGQTTNNLVLVQDIKDAFLTVSYSVNCMERFKTKIYAGSATNGDLYILKQGFDMGGSAYSMDCQFKEDFLATPILQKDAYKCYVTYETQTAGTFVISYRFDNFANQNTVPWTATTVNSTTKGIFELPLGGIHFRSIQFRIQNSNAGEQVQILGLTLVYGNLVIR